MAFGPPIESLVGGNLPALPKLGPPIEDLIGQPAPMVAPAPVDQQAADDRQRRATWYEKVLDALGVPNYAIAGGVEAALQGRNPLEGVPEGIQRHTTFGKVIEHQLSDSTLWKELKSRGLASPVAGVLGFTLDVALDPTTYLGIGGLTKAGRLARGATIGLESLEFLGTKGPELRAAQQALAKYGRLGKTAAEQATAGQRAAISMAGYNIVPRAFNERVFSLTDRVGSAVGATQFGQTVNRLLVPASKRAPEALRAAYGAVKGTRATLTRETVEKMVLPYQREVQAMAKAAGVDYKIAAAVTIDAIQKGKNPGDLPTAIANAKRLFGGDRLDDATLTRAVQGINAANAYFLGAEQAAGIKISELIGAQGYVRRLVTDEGLDAIRKSTAFRGRGAREFQLEFGAQLMRDPQLRDLTIHEINQLGRQGKLAILNNVPLKGDFFYEDPFIATAHRAMESAEALGSKSFLRSAMQLYGQPVRYGRNIPQGFRTLSNAMADELGVRETRSFAVKGVRGRRLTRTVESSNMAFPTEVADLLDSHYEKLVTPVWAQAMLRGWDKVQGAWKAWTLPIWPAYHTRNLLSDMWMMTVPQGGMPLWRYPARVTQAIRAMKGSNSAIRLGNHNYTFDGIRRLGESLGVVDYGVQRELDDMVRRPLSVPRDPLEWLSQNQFIQKAMTVGQARENSGRLAYFIERLARGDAPHVAALETKKRLFDYSELTDFERQVLRRVIPFYSWARHNIPFQLGHVFARPGYGATLEKLRDEIGVATGTESLSQGVEPLPKFLERGVPIPFGQESGGLPQFFRTQNIIPLADVSQLTGSARELAGNYLSPLLTAPTEVAFNVDIFRSQQLERFPGERRNILGVPVPQRISPLLELARPVSELQRLNPGNIFGGQEQPSALGIPRREPDVGGLSRLASFTGPGRPYAVDPDEMARVERQALTEVLRTYQWRLKQAIARGDAANAAVLETNINKLLADPASALGLR